MKIHNTSRPNAVAPSDREARSTSTRSEAAASEGPAATVALSSDAAFVNAVKNEVATSPNVRTEMVEETKAALAAGTFDGSVDLDVVVDSLLADL